MTQSTRTHSRPMQLKRNDAIILIIPQWVGRLYVGLGVVLLPWIIYLALTLPTRHRAANWDVVWTGFDIGLLVAMASTGVTALAKSLNIVMAAAATGTLLFVDAWFDIISEQGHTDFMLAVILALGIELPLAIISFYVATHALHHSARPETVQKRR